MAEQFDINLFNIRIATVRDYDAILDINRNVYKGYDYIPALFYTFFHNQNINLYVGLYCGKIVRSFVYK